MSKQLSSLLLTLTVLALTTVAPSAARAESTAGYSTRMLVKLGVAPKTDAEAQRALHALRSAHELGLRFEKRTVFGWTVVTVKTSAADAVSALGGEKAVAAAEPVTKKKLARVPNDPLMSDLWGFQSIGMSEAWDTTVGLSSQRIGLVDSGLTRDHADLRAQDVGGFDFISDPSSSLDGSGRDADYTDTDPSADFHGSHVAGTMVASADNGTGVAGINWSAGLMTARALSGSGGDGVDIVEAAAWLAGFHIDGVPDIGSNRVSVINMSLGSETPCSGFEQDAYTAILQSGVTVVAASGNSGNDAATSSPANCPGVIAVGAYGPSFALASYSNFDSRIDIVAPGGDDGFGDAGLILSVDGAGTDGYKVLEGTSMATPHVTGVVSLMQAVNPTLSPAQIRTIFLDTPVTCTNCQNHSMLDAVDAVTSAQRTTGEQTQSGPGGGSNTGNTGNTGGSSGSTGGSTGGTCPAHSHDSADGQFCECDAGFVVNSAQTACVAASSGAGGSNGGSGAVSDGGQCDPERGNWDCNQGEGCVEGTCVNGAVGDVRIGDVCRTDSDCDSGLCDRGICTRPCDGSCDEGFTCVENIIPGGICRSDDTTNITGCSQMNAEGAMPIGATMMMMMAFARRRRRSRC